MSRRPARSGARGAFVVWLRCAGWLVGGTALAAGADAPPAAGVSWSFEQEAAGGTVILPPGATLRAGAVGRALWLGAGPDGAAAVALRVGGDDPRLAAVTHPQDTHLNLGAADWTLECWLWLAPGAAGEGVILELGAVAGGHRLATRCSVLPAEEALVLSGLAAVPPEAGDEAGGTIEFTDPGGPPHRRVRPVSVTLASPQPLPRGRWFHVAVVHAAEAGTVRLLVAGRSAAVAAARFEALPRSAAAHVALGCDGERRRVLAGAIDELRVHPAVVYAAEFVPPAASP